VIEYVFALSGFMALLAMIRGPTFADRSLAAGVFVNITIIILLIYTVRIQMPLYLDISIVMAFMSFVGTLAIAKYVRDNK
jgi:multicomponent Na+:H+ antiporter subunit F